MKRGFSKSQHYTFNIARTTPCHKYIHMLSVCGYAYFYSWKNMRFYAERLTIQKITFVDEKIWNCFFPPFLPASPLFGASSVSLSPSIILQLYHPRFRSSVFAAFKTYQPSHCYVVNIKTKLCQQDDRHNHRAWESATTNTAPMTTNTSVNTC